MKNAASLLIFVCALGTVAIASSFKTVVITNSTFPSGFSVDIPDHHFLRIYNFTQDVGGSARGVVFAAAATPSATPTATPTPTPTPTCTPTPCPPTPTPTPTPTATPTPTPPPRVVLTASIIDVASPPEFIQPVVIDGPAQISVNPVPGATLVLTYRKFSEPTPSPTATP